MDKVLLGKVRGEIKEAVEGIVAGEIKASTIPLADEADHFTSSSVEGALQEVATQFSEVVLARGGKTILGDRLDETDSKLADMPYKLNSNFIASVDVNEAQCVNADSPLSIPNYLGGTNEHVHPSVLYFNRPWNGYKFWMADTAFDGALSANENPCIYVSNEGTSWNPPAGLINPVVPKPTDATSSYNADTHIFMDKDASKMYMAYKVVDKRGTLIVVRNSANGINWSEEHVVLPSISGQGNICPIIKYDGHKYILWTVDTSTTPYRLLKRTCDTPDGSYENLTICTFELPLGRSPWHFDISIYGNEYHMAMQDCGNANFGGNGSILFAKSSNGEEWDVSKAPIIRRGIGIWDKDLYKPAIVPFIKNGGFAYKMWYTGVSVGNSWYTGVADITFDKIQKADHRLTKLLCGANGMVDDATVVDLFNRADGTAMGSANTGHAWDVLQHASSLQILNKRAASTGATNQANIIDSALSDGYKVSVRVNEDSASWIVFRYSDGSHFYRFGKASAVESLQLQKLNSGTTKLASNLGISGAGDIYSVEVSNDIITCRVNGVLKCQVTDSFNNTATIHGIQTDKANTSFSEFMVEKI